MVLPDPGERLILPIGRTVTAVPNDDPRRAGVSLGATGSLAIATADIALVVTMDAADWGALARVAAAVSRALAECEAALAPAATLDMEEVAGHA